MDADSTCRPESADSAILLTYVENWIYYDPRNCLAHEQGEQNQGQKGVSLSLREEVFNSLILKSRKVVCLSGNQNDDQVEQSTNSDEEIVFPPSRLD